MDYDVVVIGGGAAGITLARQLGAAGVKTFLADAGGTSYNATVQDAYVGTNSGLDYAPLDATRLRYLGGTTNHWQGWCRPLDAFNFEVRSNIEYTGWDISKSDIDPYLSSALDILDIDPTAEWQPQQQDDVLARGLRQSPLQEVYWQWSAPTRFADKFGEELLASDVIDVRLLHSLVDLVPDATGNITTAVFRNSLSGDELRVDARYFVLACGGIENARLLLYFNDKHDTNFGNQSGLLGKCFAEHPHLLNVADFVIYEPAYRHILPEGERFGLRFLRLSDEYLRQNGLLGGAIRMVMLDDETTVQIADRLQRVANIPNRATWRAGNVALATEQIANTDSYVELGKIRDDFGIPRVDFHWQLSDIDYKSMRQLVYEFAVMLVQSDIGRCQLPAWVFDEAQTPAVIWGHHHMGTTRMASNAADGAVDMDCLLHGTNNLYVAGSSVFPTSGYANPTLTIVQLALRLADHLQARLRE